MWKDKVCQCVHVEGFTILFKIAGDMFYIDWIENRRGLRDCFEALIELSEDCKYIGGRFTNVKFLENQKSRGVEFYQHEFDPSLEFCERCKLIL